MKASLLCERCQHPSRPATHSATLEHRKEGRRTKQERVRLCADHYVKMLAGAEAGTFVVRGREL